MGGMLPRLLAPRYWPTWAAFGVLKLLSALAFAWLLALGRNRSCLAKCAILRDDVRTFITGLRFSLSTENQMRIVPDRHFIVPERHLWIHKRCEGLTQDPAYYGRREPRSA